MSIHYMGSCWNRDFIHCWRYALTHPLRWDRWECEDVADVTVLGWAWQVDWSARDRWS